MPELTEKDLQQKRQRARRGTACVYCRQNKFRCDSGDAFPNPCTRCCQAGKRCSVLTGFKRTRRRGRLEQLERELAQLRQDASQIDKGSSQAPHAEVAPLHLNNNGEGNELHEDGSNKEPMDAETIQLGSINQQGGSSLQLQHQHHTLEDIQISHDEFLVLLDNFYRYYHPQLPFLNSKAVTLREACRNPLLLWAIANASARSSPLHQDLRDRLVWPLRRLAIESTIKSLPSLVLIQALLLLCIWTPPYASLPDDPSWMLCGLATHQAMQIGLHRPGFDHEFLLNERIGGEIVETRRKTWLACFVVNQRVSTKLGLPATIQPNHSILFSTGDGKLPSALKDSIEILLKENNISAMLGNDGARPDGLRRDPLAVIEAFDSDMSQIELCRQDSWTPASRQLFLDIRLRLYLYALSPPPPPQGQGSDPLAQLYRYRIFNILLKAKATVLELLQSFLTPGDHSSISPAASVPTDVSGAPSETTMPARTPYDHHLYWTSFSYDSLAFGACALIYLARVDLSSDAATNGVSISGALLTSEEASAVRNAIVLLRSVSTLEYDHFHRSSEGIAYMASTGVGPPTRATGRSETNSSFSDTLEDTMPRSRMSANFVCYMKRKAQRRWKQDGWGRGALQLAETGLQRSPHSVAAVAETPPAIARAAEAPEVSSETRIPAAASAPHFMTWGLTQGLGGEGTDGVDFDSLLDDFFLHEWFNVGNTWEMEGGAKYGTSDAGHARYWP